MPNITLYLDNKTYWKYFMLSDDKQKEVKESMKKIVAENTSSISFGSKND